MTDTVVIVTEGATDEYGSREDGVPRTVMGRVEYRTRILRDPQTGEEISVSARFMTFSAVAIGDQCWLPGRDVTKRNESYNAIAVEAADDTRGNTLYLVSLA